MDGTYSFKIKEYGVTDRITVDKTDESACLYMGDTFNPFADPGKEDTDTHGAIEDIEIPDDVDLPYRLSFKDDLLVKLLNSDLHSFLFDPGCLLILFPLFEHDTFSSLDIRTS